LGQSANPAPVAKMRALRSLRRFGAGLGLFALLLQLTLSFAHIHADDLLGASAAGISQTVGGKALADRGQDRHAPGAPHDDCRICAVMHLAGTIVLPDPPALAVPTEFTVAALAADDPVTIVVVPRRLPFQTRAPPSA
jgi:Protein of unknown function (DUF2946)